MQNVTAPFDAYAGRYDAALERGLSLTGEPKSYFARGRVAWTARRLAQHGAQAKTVLDFGCGDGSTTPLFHELLDAEQVTGVDASPASLEQARREFGSQRAEFASRDDLVPAGQFDLAYCNGVFHHIAPDQRARELQWIYAALAPGGLFAFWENNPYNPATRWVMSRVEFDKDAILVWPREARWRMRQAGFDVLHLDYQFIFPHGLAGLRALEPTLCQLPLGGQYLVLARKPLARSGLTLVELLVVIAIIGILMAVLLPAVQMAREAVRRATCSSQLHQLALAVHSYHDTHGTLPINVSAFLEGPRPAAVRSGRGWVVGVLPFLEQQSLFEQIDENSAGDFFSGGGLLTPACRPYVQTRLAVLRCPSDGSARGLSSTQYQWEGVEVALTSYKGVIGDNRMGGSQSSFAGTEPDCHSWGGCNGLFWRGTYQEPVRLADVLDGTSNTFMLGEDVPAHNDHSAAYYANGDYASCHAPLNYFPRPPRPRDWWDVMGFRSRHPGGANFCLADGSVRFIPQTIDQPTYRALATRARGESAAVP